MRRWIVLGGVGLIGVLLVVCLVTGVALGWQHAMTATLEPPGEARSGATATLEFGVKPTATPFGQLGSPAPAVTVVTATVAAKTGVLTIVVNAREVVGDYLYGTPALQLEGGPTLAPNTVSLRGARLALLKIALNGDAQASLDFEKAPVKGAGALVFNPDSTSESIVAPKVSVPVKWDK